MADGGGSSSMIDIIRSWGKMAAGGDVIEAEISGIGPLRNTVRDVTP